MGRPGALLASDMDGTVIPLEIDSRREEEVAGLKAAVESAAHLLLAYVTGRGLGLAETAIREYGLPRPDLLVCDVGTSLYRATAGGYEADLGYARLMRNAMGGLDFLDVREHLRPVAHLLLQPEERQTEFKLSYHLPDDQDHGAIVAAVRERLEELEGGIQAVYSVGAPSGRGLLDLLPHGAAKDHALHHLHELTGVDSARVVYAGDSGNDLAALLAGFKGIVVANAGEDLRAELEVRIRNGMLTSEIHFSPYPYAKGVLEGSQHFGIL